MVEFAVAVQSLRELKNVGQPWRKFAEQNEIEAEMQNVFFEEWTNVFQEKVKPNRIYFGSEFCQYRLVSLPVVKKAVQYSWENGYEFTFATPYVHGEKYAQLIEILAWLNDEAEKTGNIIETVINDWGVYYTTQKRFPNLKIVIGRLLNKSIRDPRIANYYNAENAPEGGKRFFKRNSFFSEWFANFLSKGNIGAIEFDELIQGTETVDGATFTSSFHYPFGTVASGSACMVGFMDTDKQKKFRGNPECKQQCQFYVFELSNRLIPDMDTGVFQKGNTAFYSHKRDMVKQGLKKISDTGTARVVYSLRIPV